MGDALVTWEALIRFTPVLSPERADDPAWAKRQMATGAEAYRLLPNQTDIPLVADHDFGCELGRVREWFKLSDKLDGPWLYALCDLSEKPPPFLTRGAGASHGYKLLGGYDSWGNGAKVIQCALLEEITVCASLVPIEPEAKVSYVKQVEPVARRHQAEPETEVPATGQLLRRPGIGQVLRVR